jgi:anti-sigma factor RsiW
MTCEQWRDKLDRYLDGELEAEDARILSAHLPTCAPCSGSALERVQLKRAVHAAGKRYTADPMFKKKILRGVATPSRSRLDSQWRPQWSWTNVLALVLLAIAGLLYTWQRRDAGQQRVYSELADLHVATLASANPVDVVSSDRHTVKPWFQGKIPFTFNLPELRGSDFNLVGGRVAYLGQTSGAQLIYRIRQHEISVFIFQDRGQEISLPNGFQNRLSFNVDTWTQNGLCYFVIGDTNAGDIQTLSKLLQGAG